MSHGKSIPSLYSLRVFLAVKASHLRRANNDSTHCNHAQHSLSGLHPLYQHWHHQEWERLLLCPIIVISSWFRPFAPATDLLLLSLHRETISVPNCMLQQQLFWIIPGCVSTAWAEVRIRCSDAPPVCHAASYQPRTAYCIQADANGQK